MTIHYITEEAVRELVESEVAANKDKGYVRSPEGFVNHHMQTGRIGYQVANQIIDKHPSLAPLINPELIRTEGYVHDFTKIYEGDRLHEIGTAYLVLTEGDKRLQLVTGGTSEERTALLREMAAMFPVDYASFEELGGYQGLKHCAYPELIDQFRERLDFLRKELSDTDEPLSMERFALPYSLNQKIALFADLTNLDGKSVSASERMDDAVKRYGNPDSGFYDPIITKLTPVVRPRLLTVTNSIEELLK